MWNKLFVFLILLSTNINTQVFRNLPRVRLDVYYEALCRDCVRFFREELLPVMRQFGAYIELHTFPYGKAKTFINGRRVAFDGQHGLPEIYGNKLHACANTIFGSPAAALEFNACLMDRRSNDTAAEGCGAMLNIDPAPIQGCAKGVLGTQLLYFIGQVSSFANYTSVPHVLVNGIPLGNLSLFSAVGSAIGR